ncbi:MAG: TIGR03915 family putative DNA repair protein, partial [Bacteroidota bacterium]
IGREVHRMHAFVRFQKTKDDIYTALIEPDFNVLPLIGDHFEKRYPIMQWLIYDVKRHYGIFYDLSKVNFFTFDSSDHQRLTHLSREILSVEEKNYQILWKSYFDSVNIPERNNAKLHLQHVPKRYWKYLTEK